MVLFQPPSLDNGFASQLHDFWSLKYTFLQSTTPPDIVPKASKQLQIGQKMEAVLTCIGVIL